MEYIYFDNNKQAYAQEIPDYICKITLEKWEEFQHLALGKDYEVEKDNFIDLRKTPEYIAEKFKIKQDEKLAENDFIANKTLNNIFTIEVGENKTPCKFLYDEKTERNLTSSALGFITGQYETKQWTDEQGITVNLTAEDIETVLLTFNEFANNVWAMWGNFKQQIENAETVEELNGIELNYGNSNL